MHRADRAFRLVVTVADQAIQGEGSVRFTQKESSVDSLPLKPLAEGVCKFHVSDGVGSKIDKLYGETRVLQTVAIDAAPFRVGNRSFDLSLHCIAI